ncbi:hypothetical protein BHE74_00052956 [Ensete ventricosum]|nr:hypothetical protein BHE74_00052956 [Ensete ventricosum]
MTSPVGLSYPKVKASVRKVVDSEKHHSAIEADLPIAKEGMQIQENRIDTSPATRWRRPYIRVAVCLSIDQGELLGGHNGVEAGGRKGRGSDDEFSGAQLPKSKASVRKEVDSEERHSVAEADLLIAKEGIKMQGNE